MKKGDKDKPAEKTEASKKKGSESTSEKKTVEEDKESNHKINVRSQQKRSENEYRKKEPEKAGEASQPTKINPLAAYKPPFKEKAEKKVAKVEEKPKKVYTLDFIFSMKANNKQRPDNMAELNFPHKKRGSNGFRKKPLTEKDKFNKTVGEIRILLNKLTNSNFETISNQLLNFSYNPSLLYELMKMIFIKSTCEHYYLDVYVKLCSILFKQFNDKDNYEMNFKKLLVSKCQKQFFKMLNKEREERKKRKDSLTQNPEQKPVDDDEFSKPMMYLFDDEELKERKKEQMYGNMYLIT